jgi:hypothetical protein
LRERQRVPFEGHFASFLFSFYNFNHAGIVTHKIFKKYVQDERIFPLFLGPKYIKKVLMEGNGRENKKNGCHPLLLSPYVLKKEPFDLLF